MHIANQTTQHNPVDISPTPSTSTPPTMLRTMLFRFGFAYWMAFVFLLLATDDIGPAAASDFIDSVWNALVVWVGKHVLRIAYEIIPANNGSGDKTSDWVGLFVTACMAVIATLVWSVLDRRPSDHRRLCALLRVLMRYTLAFKMITYGLIKVFPLQFGHPSPTRLLSTYGDSSPMGLLWTFMAASQAYQIFAGAGELLGAVLLFFRRTTTLGALLLTCVLANVLMLNLCFDVPVKIHSAHYLAMAIFLALPDLSRLANVLLFHRATQPAPPDPVSPSRRWRVIRRVVKYGLIAFLVLHELRADLKRLSGRETTSWYSGYWVVSSFVRDGEDVPAIITDSTRWRRLRFQHSNDKLYVRWRFMNESYGDLYSIVLDENQQSMSLTPELEPGTPVTGPILFRYLRPDADHLTLEGKVGTTVLSVQLTRFTPDKTPLMTRGFHWISEEPFNR